MRPAPETLSRSALVRLARRLSGGGRIPDDRRALLGFVSRRLDDLGPDDPPAVFVSEEAVSWEEIEDTTRRPS